MTIETVAAFYRQTEIGQELIELVRKEVQAEGREEGRSEIIADLLHSRFGEDPRIPELATRLARRSGVEVMRAITEAPALNDLLDPIPPVRPSS